MDRRIEPEGTIAAVHPHFATCPITDTLAGTGLADNLAGDRQFFAIFDDGHHRQLPRLTGGPFRYKTCASEYVEKNKSVYKLVGQYSRDDADGVPQVCFIGVINPLSPEVETPEQVRDQLVAAAKHIPVERLGGDRRLRLLALQPRREAQARLAGLRARHRDAEDLQPGEGREDGLGELGV